jgi:hypothetical protein
MTIGPPPSCESALGKVRSVIRSRRKMGFGVFGILSPVGGTMIGRIIICQKGRVRHTSESTPPFKDDLCTVPPLRFKLFTNTCSIYSSPVRFAKFYIPAWLHQSRRKTSVSDGNAFGLDELGHNSASSPCAWNWKGQPSWRIEAFPV